MRRQDIQLLAAVRQGDTAARLEVGRRYLQGSHGFPRHIATGIDYLSHVSVKGLSEAARIIVDVLPLEELLTRPQACALEGVARAGSVRAQVKLAAWCCTSRTRGSETLRWLQLAAAAGHWGATSALAQIGVRSDTDRMSVVLRALTRAGDLNGPAVAMIAAREAAEARDLPRLCECLRAAVVLAPSIGDEVAELVVLAVRLAEDKGEELGDMAPQTYETCLEMRCRHGHRDALSILGKALCGMDCGTVRANRLVSAMNVRKGTAFLLRAADGGCDEAWLHLYRLSADHRSSVSNPQMARYFLEKAATRGTSEAQRRLGALLLRDASDLADFEEAISWLFQAAANADPHARSLLDSLVLPVAGDRDEALAAIEELAPTEPWLAMRLLVARHFGLTKLEALSMDACSGLRPWGLVVGRNPFVSQARLAAPRAVPARSREAQKALRRAAAFFEQEGTGLNATQGNLRRRSLQQRRSFERHGLDVSMFFAAASSTTLDSLRHGSKWAFRTRDALRAALA